MPSHTVPVLVLSALLAFSQVASAVDAAQPVDRSGSPAITCYRAFKQCDFRFAGYENYNYVPTFYIGGQPDRAFTPRIVSTVPGENLGVLNSNNITPEFVFYGYTSHITNFGSQRFTPTHFKPFSIPKKHRFSGVGHQTFQGNQLSVADGKCIRLYFTHYQTLDKPRGTVSGNENDVPRSANKCVVFWARA